MQRTAAESLWISSMGELVAMKTILGNGPARRNMQQFCDKIMASTWRFLASFVEEEELDKTALSVPRGFALDSLQRCILATL